MPVYKIDFNRGNDTNDGISAPWKNLSKLATLTPVTGDVIALASDSWWVLENRIALPANTNGTRASPILITKYDPFGASNEKPRISLRKTLVAGDFTYDAPNNAWVFDSTSMVATGGLNWSCFLRLGGEDALRQEAGLPLVSVDKTWSQSGRNLYVYAPAGVNPVNYYGSVEFGHSNNAFAFSGSGNFLVVEKLKICDGGGLLFAYSSSGTRTIIVRDIEASDAACTIRTFHDTGSNLTVEVLDSLFDDSQNVHIAAYSANLNVGAFLVKNCEFIGGNRGYPQGQVYLQTRLSHTHVIGNKFSGARYGTVHHQSDGCAVYSEVGADRVLVSGNIVIDTYLAFQDNSGRGSVWSGNVIARCKAAMKVTDETNVGATNHRFYNNTCLVGANLLPQGPLSISGSGWRCYKASGSAMTVDVRNNIIWDQRAGGNSYGAAILTPQVAYTGTFDRNVLRGFPANGAAEFGGTVPTVTNSINSDPLLTSDYRLTASSPCRGAGVYIPGARHMGGKKLRSTPDIGAYPYLAPRALADERSVRLVGA